MAKNSNLIRAKETKNDEFYTQYEDIQKELNHYEEHFKGKTILCNCDDPYESNFCKFFLRNFNYLQLKRLICTSYYASSVVGTQLSIFDLIDNVSESEGHGYVMDVSSVPMANGRGVSDEDINKLLKSKKCVKELKGNGDFSSPECIEYLKAADVVVTNPPFSIARQLYLPLLLQYDKKFLIVGDMTWETNKDMFPLIKDNKVWLGYNPVKEFVQPNGTKKTFGNKLWFTNLDIKKRHESMVLYKKYNEEEYPRYDNYADIIEVSKVTDIPMDYNGIMSVPISFLDKHNPDQFELVGIPAADSTFRTKTYGDYIGYKQDGTKTGRTGSTLGNCAVLVKDDHIKDYYEKDGIRVQAVFRRVFIRRKEMQE